jgi:DNA-binding transcriptional LysR family regulator
VSFGPSNICTAWENIVELYQLKTFIAVAEEGNLTKAAERIHASQPAMSAHIKALEEELGLPLFLRTPRGMQLTESGQGLKRKAETILLATDDMVNQAKVYREDLSGSLHVALNTDPEFLRITELISTLAETHPNIKLRLSQSYSASILHDVRDRRIDAGFCFFQNNNSEIEQISLQEIPVRIIAPAAWAAKVEGHSIEQLAALPWIKPDDECPFMKIVDGIFKDSGIAMTNYIEADSEDVIRQLVAAGKGISVIKQHDANTMVSAGTAVICETGPVLSLNINFLTPKNRQNDPLLQALIDAVVSIWNV